MPLLGELQRVFENTYGRAAGVELEACVVGPRRCAEWVARSPGQHAELSDWARFFYHVEGTTLRLALYYDEGVIRALEARDPRRGLTEANVLPFLVFAEECSHAVHTTLAFKDGGASRVTGDEFLAELELLARIDAYLVLSHFVRGLGGHFTRADRAWVRRQAVSRWDVPYEDPALEARYRPAARLAGAFVDRLEDLPPSRRLTELRRFRSLPLARKRARLARRN